MEDIQTIQLILSHLYGSGYLLMPKEPHYKEGASSQELGHKTNQRHLNKINKPN